jgi:hypothetical protein
LGDLVLYSLDDWEDHVAEMGGIWQLLAKKWCKVHQANASGNLFTMGNTRR